ncbi:retinol dehydrogenase 12 isoform X3 [Ictalurus punctatus]|uniref:Retinol dehydrogenase 12 isoform X3 n=1 Tax=Ictalurus punctatus TaxID=7998 RepID=A0A2D0RCW9_ICTPU|nr:retinol dehydrogenase 12 isoform X3 [Ictalurus punctatus]
MCSAAHFPSSSCVRAFFFGEWSSTVRLDGKTVIITGANTGIGKETTRDLAKRGARIIMACRDTVKAEAALKEIVTESGNQNVIIRKLDLADTKSIRAFAEVINNEEKQLHILINNAGVMMCPYSKTADGFEMQFGVNHLGHFLLTLLLIDLLKKSAPSRIIILSSMAHSWGTIKLDDINSERSYHSRRAYGQSKLANILCARSLAKRLKGIVRTELKRHMNLGLLCMWKMVRPFTKTSAQGAQTSIYCAVEPALDSHSGGYFSNCRPASCTRAARDDGTAQKLWDLSCQMLGVSWE